MPISQSPQEIVDYIIGFLYNDRKALGSSSLVCRSWRPSSQQALFHAIRVQLAKQSLNDAVSFLTQMSDTPGAPWAPPQRHVRHFTIQGTGISTKDGFVITPQDLTMIFRILPQLRSLTLLSLSFGDDQGPFASERYPLQLLALRNVFGKGTRSSLVSSLLSICSPRALHLSSLNFVTSASQIAWPEPIPNLPGVEFLILRSRWSIVPFLELFGHGALKSLDVSCYVTSDVQALGHFLLRAGHHLECYSLDLTDFIMRTPNRTWHPNVLVKMLFILL